MKRVFNKVWIGMLALFALIIGACCSNQSTDNPNKMTKKQLKERIAKLKAAVEDREMSCVYGSPEIIAEYGRETARMRRELDSLQNELDNYGKSK